MKNIGFYPCILRNKLIQYKPLNVITLGQCQSENINRMITLTKNNIYPPNEQYFKFWVITEIKINKLFGRNRLQGLTIGLKN